MSSRESEQELRIILLTFLLLYLRVNRSIFSDLRTTINRTMFGRKERLHEQVDFDLIWPEARETKFEEEAEGLRIG